MSDQLSAFDQEQVSRAVQWVCSIESVPVCQPIDRKFAVNGLSLVCLPPGLYPDDNPWRLNDNLSYRFYHWSVIPIAHCPRHHGQRKGFGLGIPTFSLEQEQRLIKLVGELVKCTLCGNTPVMYWRDQQSNNDGSITMSAGYCDKCLRRFDGDCGATRLSEPLRHKEPDFRQRTRKALDEARKWSQDVECESCVELIYMNGGAFVDTHSTLRRTYRRDQ